MGFRELDLATSYETSGSLSQLLDEFYIPVLEKSKKYYRIAGFFSSSALSVAAEGIEGLIKNGGKMYLLISPELSEEDYNVIRTHGNIDNIQMFSEFDAGTMPDEHLKALAWLLDNGKLEIRIVVGKKSHDSLFHQKIGVAFDENEDIVSFSGSINETAQAWLYNIEEFKVFRSWEDGQIGYLKSDLEKFLAYWKNEKTEIAEVYDIPSSVREKIVKIKPRDVFDLNIMRRYSKDRKNRENKLSLFPHQMNAAEKWKENGYSLLMEMATGTGKTRTAIDCMLEKLKDKETLLIIVSTPQNTLSRQWRQETEKLGIVTDRNLIIDGSNSGWKKDLEMVLLDLNDRLINTAVIFTTHDTASSDRFTAIVRENKRNTKVLFICDEVHAAGAAKRKNALLPEYEYRIGLSATPERMFDESGTEYIREYFGSASYEFTIADALHTVNPLTGKPFLNQYRYYPVFVELTDEENKKYAKVSRQIAIMKARDDCDPNDLQKLYDRRADIGKNAAGKTDCLRALLLQLVPSKIQDTILFVTDKQIQPSFDIIDELKIKRAKITESESAAKVVDTEGKTERQNIISQFVNRQIQILVGMKCLDEGIDIPNARVAVLMASSTNPREFVQRVGRVIRPALGKEVSEIYDFIAVPSGVAGTGLLAKEAQRANHIAKNALNYEDVKSLFRNNGVELDADQ